MSREIYLYICVCVLIFLIITTLIIIIIFFTIDSVVMRESVCVSVYVNVCGNVK